MKPENFRQLLLKPGTLLGILGEEIGPGLVKGTLASYIVVEFPFSIDAREEVVWDAAIMMTLFTPLHVRVMNGQEYHGNDLLLIHRNPQCAWDNNDPNVLVFGIRESEFLEGGPLAHNIWQPKTIWLEDHATMTVEDPSAPSEISQLLRKRDEERRSKRMSSDLFVSLRDLSKKVSPDEKLKMLRRELREPLVLIQSAVSSLEGIDPMALKGLPADMDAKRFGGTIKMLGRASQELDEILDAFTLDDL